nr:hypothetical protein [Tanacetum cinerariifolium]
FESSAVDSSFKPSSRLSRKRCRSRATTMPLSTPASGALVPTRADLFPPHIKADAAAIEVTAYMDVEVRINAGLEAESLIASEERALERSNTRLQDTLMMESMRADRLWRHMGFMEDELHRSEGFNTMTC